MNKFKIGDRVKVKECSYEQGISCIGHEGIIVNIDYNYDYFYTIKFDSGFIPAHANCYRDDELILLPKKRNKPTKQKELISFLLYASIQSALFGRFFIISFCD